MTPKEKAQELVAKMYNQMEDEDAIALSIAKQCALIAVDEIFYALSFNSDTDISEAYWEKVKQEIEKI